MSVVAVSSGMHAPADLAARGRQLAAPRRLWLLAIFLYGVGDTVTTGIGLSVGLTEVGPLVAPLIKRYGLVVVPAMKLVVFVAMYAFWRLMPQSQRIGVPLGLSAVGFAVTVWNGYLLAVVLL